MSSVFLFILYSLILVIILYCSMGLVKLLSMNTTINTIIYYNYSTVCVLLVVYIPTCLLLLLLSLSVNRNLIHLFDLLFQYVFCLNNLLLHIFFYFSCIHDLILISFECIVLFLCVCRGGECFTLFFSKKTHQGYLYFVLELQSVNN